jgi:hypothetical protein
LTLEACTQKSRKRLFQQLHRMKPDQMTTLENQAQSCVMT